MNRIALAVGFWIVATSVYAAEDGLITKPSKYSVKETISKFEAAVKEKEAAGFVVFTQIDHGPDTVITRVWQALPSGVEKEVSGPRLEFQRHADGWRMGPITISDAAFDKKVIPLIDASTGDALLNGPAVSK